MPIRRRRVVASLKSVLLESPGVPKHIVLAYSGGLDTSVMIHWLQKQHNAKVTAAILDLGQGKASLDEAGKRAKANGAEHFVVLPA